MEEPEAAQDLKNLPRMREQTEDNGPSKPRKAICTQPAQMKLLTSSVVYSRIWETFLVRILHKIQLLILKCCSGPTVMDTGLWTGDVELQP